MAMYLSSPLPGIDLSITRCNGLPGSGDQTVHGMLCPSGLCISMLCLVGAVLRYAPLHARKRYHVAQHLYSNEFHVDQVMR